MKIERIDHFMSKLRQEDSNKGIKKVSLEEMEYLRNGTETLSTLRNLLTKYRNEIRKYPNLKNALPFLNLSNYQS